MCCRIFEPENRSPLFLKRCHSLIDVLTHNLLSESGASETLSWDYGYRPSGRLSSTNLLDALQPEYVPDLAKTIAYSSTSLPGEAANELDQNEEIGDSETGTQSLAYDGRGNLTTQNGRVYTYDFENRLTGFVESTTTVSYDYDVSGRRVGSEANRQWFEVKPNGEQPGSPLPSRR